MKRKHLFAGFFLGIVVILSLFVLGHKQKRDRLLIPEGYIGWVVVHFSIEGAPHLNVEDGFRLIEIDSKGEAYTSSPLIPGEGYYDEYYFVSSTGKRSMVSTNLFGAGGGTQGALDTEGKYTTICSFIWIGTKEQFENMGTPDVGDKCK